MKIRYTVEIDDIAALNQLYLDKSPSTDRHDRRMNVILGVAFGVLAVVFGLGRSWLLSMIFAVCFITNIQWHFRFGRKVTVKQVQKSYSDGEKAFIFGEQEFELLSDSVRHTNSVSETTLKFAGIEKVEATATHVFVFTTHLTAYVIPKAKVSEGDLDAFVAGLKDKLQPTEIIRV